MAGYFTRRSFGREVDKKLKERNIIRDSELCGMFDKDVDVTHGSPVRNMINDVIQEKDVSRNVIRHGRDTIYAKDVDKALEYELNSDISKVDWKKSFKDFFKEFKSGIAIFNKPHPNEKEYNEDTKKWTYHLEKRFLEKHLDKSEMSKYKDKDLYIENDREKGLSLKSYDEKIERSLEFDSKITDEKSDRRLEPYRNLMKSLELDPIRTKGGNRPKVLEAVDSRGEKIMVLATTRNDITVPYSAVYKDKYDSKKDEKKILQGTLEPMERASALARCIHENRSRNNSIRIKDKNGYSEIKPAEFDDTNFALLARFQNVSLDQMLDESQQKEFPYPDIAERLVQSMDNDLEISDMESKELEEEFTEDELEKHSQIYGRILKPKNDMDGDGIGDAVDPNPTTPEQEHVEKQRDFSNDMLDIPY